MHYSLQEHFNINATRMLPQAMRNRTNTLSHNLLLHLKFWCKLWSVVLPLYH